MVQMIRIIVIENWTNTRTYRNEEPLELLVKAPLKTEIGLKPDILIEG
jgi:hypothetical protein